ncbi:MAG: c-type cytochrome domain-containing protein [Rhodospirillales bacterium]
MNAKALIAGLGGVALVIGLVAGTGDATGATEEQVSYKLDVQPILLSRCGECHMPGGEGYRASGLDVSTYAGLMRGTKHGPVVIAGDPLRSNLIVLIEGRADPSLRMPHSGPPLLKPQIQIIRDWVKQGAKDN